MLKFIETRKAPVIAIKLQQMGCATKSIDQENGRMFIHGGRLPGKLKAAQGGKDVHYCTGGHFSVAARMRKRTRASVAGG